jgi:hypothetical protein
MMDQMDRLLWERARTGLTSRFIDPDGDVYYCARCGAILNTLPIPEGPTLIHMHCPSCQQRGES